MKYQMKIRNRINTIRTLLNGETLLKPQTFQCSASFQENPDSQPLEQNSENSTEIEPIILQKGLTSLENPVLRGSFTLILDEKKT